MRWILAPLLTLVTLVQGQVFQWTQLAPFPGSARDDASAFSVGGKIFVGTGREVSFALTNDWYAFDVEQSAWNTVTALPASGRQYCSTFTDGTYGYLFGGVDANGPLSELWRYDPLTDNWQQMASLPAPGRYATVAFDNGIICTGMLDGGVPTNECWQYSAIGDTWQQRSGMPGTARHRACGSGAYVRVMGGADAAGNALSDGYAYDEINDAWSPFPDLPDPRLGADAVHDPLWNDTYVAGGASSSTQFHDDAWISSMNSWSPIAPFGGGGRRGAVMAFAEDPVSPILRYVFYGTGVDAIQRYNDWWVYTIITESMTERSMARLVAYPNPSTGPVRIALPHRGSPRYIVCDPSGRMITTGHLSPDGRLDLSSLAAGEYLIRVPDGTHDHYGRCSIIRP